MVSFTNLKIGLKGACIDKGTLPEWKGPGNAC